jgi:hypothetical protein
MQAQPVTCSVGLVISGPFHASLPLNRHLQHQNSTEAMSIDIDNFLIMNFYFLVTKLFSHLFSILQLILQRKVVGVGGCS